MIYQNNTREAVLAMEKHRLGNYGENKEYIDEICPVCDSLNPEYFYIKYNKECVGCSECLIRAETLR